jgi:DNA-binding IclR family transcriptional regulator
MTAIAPSSGGYRESNSTADRALTILNMFTETQPAVSAIEVAEALGVARSTAYRYLQSLVGSSFLEEVPGGGFRLGMRILELARVARRGYGLSDISVPIMKDLAERFHQTVLLTRRIGNSIICVERQEADGQYIRLSYERGSSLPINAGASALVLLAWLPEAEVRALLAGQPLAKFNESTLTDVDLLVDRLKSIKSQGYSVTYGEVDSDMIGLAVPIFTDPDTVAAGLSFVAMQTRLPEAERQNLVAELLVSAGKISHLLQISS